MILTKKLSSESASEDSFNHLYYYFILIDNKRVIYLQPINITQIEKIFSELVLGDTFPNPTLVKLLKVK